MTYISVYFYLKVVGNFTISKIDIRTQYFYLNLAHGMVMLFDIGR